MSIDERLRSGLAGAVDDVLRPDLDAELSDMLRRAGRRNRVRRAAYAGGLAAAALAVVASLTLAGDPSPDGAEPVAPPTGGVLDSGRGSAEDPAPLGPGTYTLPFLGGDDNAPWGEIEVPSGWGQDRLLLATGPDLDPHLRRIELMVPTMVAPDPCEGSLRPVRSGVDAIVTALERQRAVRPGAPRPVTVNGYPGQVVRFQVPLRLDVARCRSGELTPLASALGWTSVFPGWTYRLWVLDVGRSAVVIMAAHGPEATAEEVAELTGMVRGIDFVAPPRT